ncbi:hypothetical protein [uncultured Sphingomonas sp.]|uniref:hypothetical protein n=1 Tax=uncultured Sphingomonas sp. TaxID=158754 RepID=UPI0035CA0B12
MSALLTRERIRRYAVQLALGLGAGFALGMAVHQAHAEDARSLLADPKRLDIVQAGCKTNQPWATGALCREAAQAIRLRFRGAGVRYTPHRAEPYPSRPAAKPSTPAAPASMSPGKPKAHPRPRPSRVL